MVCSSTLLIPIMTCCNWKMLRKHKDDRRHGTALYGEQLCRLGLFCLEKICHKDMWERSAKSWGKGEEASDETLSSEGYLFMQWGAGLEKSFPKDVDAKCLWNLKRRHGQGLRRDFYSVLQIDKPHQAQELPWCRHGLGLGEQSHAVPCSPALFPLFLATFLWQLWWQDCGLGHRSLNSHDSSYSSTYVQFRYLNIHVVLGLYICPQYLNSKWGWEVE